MLKVCLCDDNPIIIAKYSGLVEKAAGKAGLETQITTFMCGEDLVASGTDYDIIYQDILMGGMNGIDTARQMRTNGYDKVIIFLTSSEEYVFDSFDTMPLEYLGKGEVSDARFEEVFLHAVRVVSEPDEAVYELNGQAVSLKDIWMIEDRGNIVLHRDGGEEQIDGSFETMKDELAQKGFALSDDKHLVNLDYIDRINHDDLVLVNGVTIVLAPQYEEAFRNAFSAYLTGGVS